MKKKLLAIVLAFIMIVDAACGTYQEEEKKKDKKPRETTTEATTEATTSETTKPNTPTPVPASNPSGYEGGTVFNGHTYKMFDDGISWARAKEACEQMGGHLVTITSQQEQDFIESIIPSGVTYYWIGLTDEASEGDFRWVTGEPLSYNNWLIGQPDNYDNSEHYVTIPSMDLEYSDWVSYFGQWNDSPDFGNEIHSDTGYICEWEEELVNNESFAVTSFNGHYYSIIDHKDMNWEEAKAFCEANGGHLVTITSQEEQDFVNMLMLPGDSLYYWIGLSDATSEGDFRWVTGETSSFTNWGELQPDDYNGIEEYVLLSNRSIVYADWYISMFTWNDVALEGDRDHSLSDVGFICEWDFIDAELESRKQNFIQLLQNAFAENGITATIDPNTGEVTLDAEILFASGSSTVSNDGMAVLNSFMSALTSILSSGEYRDFISQIVVQGHTDSNGDYMSNLDLSIARAESVVDICLDSEGATQFASLFDAEGCSYDNLIYDANGREDQAASRRVVFIFYINM